MKPVMSPTKKYFDFLQLCDTQRTLLQKSCAFMSLKHMVLFEIIALKHAQGNPMTISEVMGLQRIASSAALHVRIDNLREARMIQVMSKNGNRRTKYLVPSDKGERYLHRMGELLQSMFVTRQTQDK